MICPECNAPDLKIIASYCPNCDGSGMCHECCGDDPECEAFDGVATTLSAAIPERTV